MSENLKVLYTKEELSQIIAQIAKEINTDYKDEEIVAIAILKGSVFFATDLLRLLRMPLQLSFLWVSSYGNETESSRNVKFLCDVDVDLTGKKVLIIEDLADSGITLTKVMEHLQNKKAQEIKVCVLFDKKVCRKVEFQPDYYGKIIEDFFIVGYGFDKANKFRNLENIYHII